MVFFLTLIRYFYYPFYGAAYYPSFYDKSEVLSREATSCLKLSKLNRIKYKVLLSDYNERLFFSGHNL